LLKVIILYEEREYIVLASYLNNIRRNFKKKKVLFDFEKTFISLINKLISLPQKEHKEKLVIFRTKLRDFLSSSVSIQREFLLYFNYLGWLDYQIDKKEFKKLCYWNLESISDDL